MVHFGVRNVNHAAHSNQSIGPPDRSSSAESSSGFAPFSQSRAAAFSAERWLRNSLKAGGRCRDRVRTTSARALARKPELVLAEPIRGSGNLRLPCIHAAFCFDDCPSMHFDPGLEGRLQWWEAASIGEA